ncbi:unnamed protein product [Pleuronectes platessa]|uniref:Uncharacterized protein n=1 Tax=Pleuronectes platessa TaxID=8262 RepID=A0A9N7TXD0_PLEPL|nr:unnamed protein product [Pleuronectes platessa]
MTARLPSHHPQRSPSNNGGRGGDLPGTKRAAGGSFSKHGAGEDEGEEANFRRAPFLSTVEAGKEGDKKQQRDTYLNFYYYVRTYAQQEMCANLRCRRCAPQDVRRHRCAQDVRCRRCAPQDLLDG